MRAADLSGASGPAATRPAAGRLWRAPLAAKLAFGFIGLVAFVLIVNGAVNAVLSYSQAKRAALEVQSEKARAAAERVGVFLDEIQTELGWTAGVEWGYSKPEQQSYDFIRLLRQTPAITALSFIDGKGREQLAVSRLEPDAVGSGRDFSADPRFLRAVADKIWFGPVEFRRGSEPYMTVALAHVGKTSGVTVADVNLKLVWDVVSAIHVGDKGFAYVVDDKGRLIAHPDLSLVLRDTDFSHLPQVAAALSRPGASEAEVARSLDGLSVLTAHAVAPKTQWTVFVEQPLSEALATAYRSLLRSLALLGLGLALAAVSGVALARRMAAPIRLLQAGAEKLGAGDLAQRLDIRTGDEIEALAGGFNRMAERLQASYENLEGKIEARTKDLNEALAQQTATADVLKVISRSVFDLDAVLQTLIDTAVGLTRGSRGTIFIRDGDVLFARAFHRNVPVELRDYLARERWPVEGDSQMARAAREGVVVHVADLSLSQIESDRETRKRAAFGAGLWAPLMRDGHAIGVFGVPREQPIPFTDREIDLVRSFADQAVIAIENARLFEEVQVRTRDLSEALARQTASAEILRVIAGSPTDVQPVFDAIARSAVELCEGGFGGVFQLRNGLIHRVASHAKARSEWRAASANTGQSVYPTAPHRGLIAGRAILDGATVHVPDVSADPEYTGSGFVELGLRAVLSTPMMRNGEPIGAINVFRAEARPFSDSQTELLKTFADQAVIAINNVNLFNETQEALQQQTATADVLKAISRSAFDLDSVLKTLVDSARELCHASIASINVVDGEFLRFRALAGGSLEFETFLRDHPFPVAAPSRANNAGRVLLTQEASYIEDATSEPDYNFGEAPQRGGFRSLLGVPLMRGGQVIGVFQIGSPEPRALNQRQIDLVRTFADQAVIAIENSRLFEEVQTRTRELQASLDDLRKTQDRLVQSEKLASLGQLTAGIAHEIKNPLNFVNNFAALSRELLEELRESLLQLPEEVKAEADELLGLIDSNLEKVVSHGKRADSIVKNMLLHSREGAGERTRVNINAMVEEALNLGYHGARAEKPGFNVTLERVFDPQAGEADLYLQEVTRVLLNLISNGFYASAKRALSEGADYAPTLRVTTRDRRHNVEIRIRDNGVGIPEEVRAKMFNPFFTTKPAGEGTGLGLSLSHDIVVKQHGGALDVETEPGAFTEFILALPRESAKGAKSDKS